MINTENLEYGIEYDITTNSGKVYEGWYLYSLECGYFSRLEGSQTGGLIYAESVTLVTESSGHEDSAGETTN